MVSSNYSYLIIIPTVVNVLEMGPQGFGDQKKNWDHPDHNSWYQQRYLEESWGDLLLTGLQWKTSG